MFHRPVLYQVNSPLKLPHVFVTLDRAIQFCVVRINREITDIFDFVKHAFSEQDEQNWAAMRPLWHSGQWLNDHVFVNPSFYVHMVGRRYKIHPNPVERHWHREICQHGGQLDMVDSVKRFCEI